MSAIAHGYQAITLDAASFRIVDRAGIGAVEEIRGSGSISHGSIIYGNSSSDISSGAASN